MTKKDFIRFAAYIKNHASDKATRYTMAQMVIACQDNPNFDRSRFLTACGLD